MLNQPERLKEERAGYSIVVQKAGRCVLKDVIEGYETLIVFLRHAGVPIEEGWMPAGEHLAKCEDGCLFSLHRDALRCSTSSRLLVDLTVDQDFLCLEPAIMNEMGLDLLYRSLCRD